MVEKVVLSFLNDLQNNNNREWFHANKAYYDQARLSFLKTTGELIAMVNDIDPTVGLQKPEDCIYRIFRDTRFSNDKTPYKTNFGAYVNRGGRKSPFAGYYLHLQPGQCFVACGIYMPEPNVLQAVRDEIYHRTSAYKDIITKPDVIRLFGNVEGDKLKTAPKGFDRNFAEIDLIRYKSYNLVHYLKEEEVLQPEFANHLIQMLTLMVPFNSFFNGVIEDLVNL